MVPSSKVKLSQGRISLTGRGRTSYLILQMKTFHTKQVGGLPGVWEEWIIFEKVSSVESYYCQGHPLPVHDPEAGEAEQLAVSLSEGETVLQENSRVVRHHHQTVKKVKHKKVQ